MVKFYPRRYLMILVLRYVSVVAWYIYTLELKPCSFSQNEGLKLIVDSDPGVKEMLVDRICFKISSGIDNSTDIHLSPIR